MNITNLNQLNDVLLQQLPICVENLANNILESWKSNLNQFWYDRRPDSEFYHRTYDMYNALTVSPVMKNGNEFTCEIYYDLNKIGLYGVEKGMFPSHQSVVDAESYQNWMNFLIEEGNEHGGHPIVKMEGSGAREYTLNEYISGDVYLKRMANMIKEQLGCEVIIK